ncbi:MAG: Clp1/GlmU family protein [Desulfurococcaceae archaeon]
MVKVILNEGKVIHVYGSALIEVLKGSISIYGKRVKASEKVLLHKYRSYPLVALEESVINLVMPEESYIKEVKDQVIYEWMSIAEEIIDEEHKAVVVIGGVDSGKSSFITLLSNKFVEKGFKIAVIDSDIGQADIGPPGFIALGVPEKQIIWLRELKPLSMKFIGDIRPQYYVDKIICEVLNLKNLALQELKASVVLVNTDGWISDPQAIAYKYKFIEAVEPTALIVLGIDLKGLFKHFEKTGVRVFELSSPLHAKQRDRDERRKLRSERYASFLKEAPLRKYKLSELMIDGFQLLQGVDVDPMKIRSETGINAIYASINADTLNIVVQQSISEVEVDRVKKVFGVSKARVYYPGFEKGFYVALTDYMEADHPGLVDEIDFLNKVIAVYTHFEGRPKMIKFSKIKLSRDYFDQLVE